MIIRAVTSAKDSIEIELATRRRHAVLRASIVCALAVGSLRIANAADTNASSSFFGDTKPIFDARLRDEQVEQIGIPDDADALTLRVRLGFETGKLLKTSLLAEGEFVSALKDDYNDTIASHGHATFATVPDPESTDLNRLQLVNTALPKTTITLGRQRINLDDQRFVGNSGWRQNEQTFDAVRLVNKGAKDLTIDVTYLNRVLRVYGEDSPQGRYDGDSFLANIAYQTPIGKFTGFSYLLKFDPIVGVPAAVRDSSATYGLRFSGEHPAGNIKLIYTASYAQQSDYGENPLTFDNNYSLFEFGIAYKVLSVMAGLETLEGDGVKGFTTPLATLHKFQGWADKFTTTPANGIKDQYLNLGLNFKKVGALDTLSFATIYHDYQSDRLSLDYGTEMDLQLQAKWKRITATLKYADYSADALATDTTKLWAQVEFVW